MTVVCNGVYSYPDGTDSNFPLQGQSNLGGEYANGCWEHTYGCMCNGDSGFGWSCYGAYSPPLGVNINWGSAPFASSDATITTNILIKAVHYNEIRYYLNQQRIRFGLSPTGSDVITGHLINGSEWDALRTSLNDLTTNIANQIEPGQLPYNSGNPEPYPWSVDLNYGQCNSYLTGHNEPYHSNYFYPAAGNPVLAGSLNTNPPAVPYPSQIGFRNPLTLGVNDFRGWINVLNASFCSSNFICQCNCQSN